MLTIPKDAQDDSKGRSSLTGQGQEAEKSGEDNEFCDGGVHEDTVCDYDGQVEQHAGNPLRMLCETLAPRHEGVENSCWIGLVGRLECHGGNDSRVCGAGCAERRAVDAISRSISRHRDQDHVQDASFVSNSAEALLFPVNREPFAQDQLMNNRV